MDDEFEPEERYELRAQSKPLRELIKTESFLVRGLHLPKIRTIPFSPSIVLEVLPEDSSIPIRELTFSGYTDMKEGDIINAKMPRYHKHGFDPSNSNKVVTPKDIFYTDRGFYREREVAITLTLIGLSGESLRTEFSDDYSFFRSG